METADIASLAVSHSYDETADLIKYLTPQKGTSALWIRKGMGAIFFPDDGHMPGLRLDPSHPVRIRKTVVKVRVRWCGRMMLFGRSWFFMRRYILDTTPKYNFMAAVWMPPKKAETLICALKPVKILPTAITIHIMGRWISFSIRVSYSAFALCVGNTIFMLTLLYKKRYSDNSS